MVGVLTDAGGIPIRDVRVESIEHGQRTDKEGRFAIAFKPPEQYVGFQQQHTHFRRVRREADDGKVVTIGLPRFRDAELKCKLSRPCDAELTWDLGEGLSARVNASCNPGKITPLPGVPVGDPTLACAAGIGEVPMSVELRVRDERFEVWAAPVPVRVEVRAPDGSAPSSCSVRVGTKPARRSGEGFWVADARGGETVVVFCDGRPAVPKRLEPGQEGVEVPWTAQGPNLELSNLPGAQAIWLTHVGKGGWAVQIPVGEDGQLPLPPLAAGLYRLVLGEPSLLLDAPLLEPEVPDGVAVFSVAGEGGAVGTLRIAADMASGTIRSEGP